MKKYILAFIISVPLWLNAQINDNFSDGDFTQNPTWSGDDASFLITSEQLQSNGPNVSGSKIYLSTQSTLIHQTEWSFLVDLKFNPTATTFTRIYLVSSSNDLKDSLDGYFIHIGNTNDDYVKLYRQSGTTVTELFTGSTSLGSGNIKARIKVTRDNSGSWTIYTDKTGGFNYNLEGNVNDNTFTSTDFFGVYAEYSTASRYNLYYFDDFYVGPIIVDTVPPALQQVNVDNNLRLSLLFSEAVEQVSAENTLHYNLSPSPGMPLAAQRDAGNNALVFLDFASPLTVGQNYQLTVYNIEDLSGNILTSQTFNFTYYLPAPYDIVINEIMADPSPVVGLPDFEYVELYNTTNAAVNIQGWKLKYGSTEKILPSVVIPPDSFVVLTTAAGAPAFASFCNVAIVDGLSSTSLTNAGTTLILSDNTGQQIHVVSYSDTWYQESNKIDGGWSLEQISPLSPCGNMNNWKASTDASGGTPGRRNSIYNPLPDTKAPSILRAGVIDSVTVEVHFSEYMNGATLTAIQSYTVDNNLGQPLSVTTQGPLFQSVVLKFANQIQPIIKYKITASSQLTDCAGNALPQNAFAFFGLPQTCEPNDVVINELLSNPPTGGNDYVEIYNRSNKIIDLKNLGLASKDTLLNELISIKVISDNSFLIFPGDYMILTVSKQKVLDYYLSQNPDNFVEMASLPTYNNSDGIVVLADNANQIIDMLVYTEDMHYPLLKSFKGVAFERISFDRPANDPSNWHSAAEAYGFGTPTYKNSQFGIALVGQGEITLSPDIFSPDNDGHNDVLNIAYAFDKPGHVATIMIYDAAGRQIRKLISNELLGTEGVFSWDGITDSNLKAPIGIYVVYIEVFAIDGQVKTFKKTAVLGGRLGE